MLAEYFGACTTKSRLHAFGRGFQTRYDCIRLKVCNHEKRSLQYSVKPRLTYCIYVRDLLLLFNVIIKRF